MIYSKKYTEYDFNFLKEITELIIANLTELNDCFAGTTGKQGEIGCKKFLFQSKVALNLIGNIALLRKSEQICKMLKSQEEVDRSLVESFQRECHKEIINLKARLLFYQSFSLVAPYSY
jgi:hypothetical protein